MVHPLRQSERHELRLGAAGSGVDPVHPGKVIETIDLTQDLQTELPKLVRLSKRATVFLWCARPDREIAERIRRALQAQDYGDWFDEAATPGPD